MFSLILHEAGVWETTCQDFSVRDQRHNLAQKLPGLPKRANISTRSRDDSYWKIRRYEHHFQRRPEATGDRRSDEPIHLDADRRPPEANKMMATQILNDLLEATRGGRDEYPRWRHSDHRDEHLDSYGFNRPLSLLSNMVISSKCADFYYPPHPPHTHDRTPFEQWAFDKVTVAF